MIVFVIDHKLDPSNGYIQVIIFLSKKIIERWWWRWWFWQVMTLLGLKTRLSATRRSRKINLISKSRKSCMPLLITWSSVRECGSTTELLVGWCLLLTAVSFVDAFAVSSVETPKKCKQTKAKIEREGEERWSFVSVCCDANNDSRAAMRFLMRTHALLRRTTSKRLKANRAESCSQSLLIDSCSSSSTLCWSHSKLSYRNVGCHRLEDH